MEKPAAAAEASDRVPIAGRLKTRLVGLAMGLEERLTDSVPAYAFAVQLEERLRLTYSVLPPGRARIAVQVRDRSEA